MQINPHSIKKYGKGRFISSNTKIHSNIGMIHDYISESLVLEPVEGQIFKNIHFIREVPQSVKDKITDEFGAVYSSNDEAYIIDVGEDIHIYSGSDRGLFYGGITLLQLVKNQYVEKQLIYDFPFCSERGFKIYLPGKNNIAFFKKFINMLCHYKYNTVMIEIGGAMEYKKHPEINRKWVEYCSEMSEYSGKTREIQLKTFRWYKNSIHVENGEGSYLPQETVKELVNYCKERKLTVIPEVPSLSHCDYILNAYPHLKERMEDSYPDTYCPSNPETYEILFDILDEVIDVFKPEKINIGHDEIYSMGLCEKCRNKKPEQLYADDITKIYSYLKNRGAKTIIWGDKLLNAFDQKGNPIGGSEIQMYENYDPECGQFWGTIPPTYGAMDLIPEDIGIHHWYWEFGEEHERKYLVKNLEVTFGNFLGSKCTNWKERIQQGVKGGIISNWSTLNEQILQRNRLLFEMAYAAIMFWSKDYDESNTEQLRKDTFEKLFNYHLDAAMRESASSYKGKDFCRFIKITHTTNKYIVYKEFVDGIFATDEEYRLGEYILKYEDGTITELPIVYGYNISNDSLSWSKPDWSMMEVSYATLPVLADGKTHYQCFFVNPYPEKKIAGIKLNVNHKKQEELNETYDVFLAGVEYLP